MLNRSQPRMLAAKDDAERAKEAGAVPSRNAAAPATAAGRRSTTDGRRPTADGRHSTAAGAAEPVEAIPAAPARAAVPAVERAIALLDALANAPKPQSLAELARLLALPKSSVHGLLATLAGAGLARRDDDGAFALGPKALQWADAYATQSDVLRSFHAHAHEFAALRAETVMLATLDGAHVLYLACRPGSRPLAVNFRVGGRFPAAITSSGKAMLASLSDHQIRARVGDVGASRQTRHSVGSIGALLKQLAQYRQQGWAVDDEETAEGMQCFGAAVFSAQRVEPIAAVAVSVIKAGLSVRRRADLVNAIRGLAARLSHELGATAHDAAADARRSAAGVRRAAR